MFDPAAFKTLVREAVQDLLNPRVSAPPPDEEDGVLTVEELAAYLHIGKTAAYALVHSDGFMAAVPVTRIGNRIVVPRWRVRRWLDAGGKAETTPLSPEARLRLAEHS